MGLFDPINDNLVNVAWETWPKIDARDMKHVKTEEENIDETRTRARHVTHSS